MTFFLYQYAFDARTSSDTGISPGVHEHLPLLLQQERSTGALSTIVSAAGLAALANAGTCTAWKREALRLYGKALQQLRIELEDSVRVKSDSTLAAVMLMGTFEVMTCHQLQEPLPYALKTWSRWTESGQSTVEASLNRFSELNEHLAAVRAEIKRKGICSPAIVAAMLEPVDGMLEDWRMKLPDSWRIKSYRNLGSGVDPVGSWELQYDEYPSFWVATTWNNYRMVRILIHESIMTATIKYGSDEEKKNLQHSVKTLMEMANGICYSVAYILGDRRNRLHSEGTSQAERCDAPKPGGYLLLWPLFLAGSLSTTSKDQRRWMALVLRDIGLRMGMQLAVSMAMKLEQTTTSFSDRELWLIGEFFPS
ncbi:hypothetical protein ACHAQJ_002523 [Trichoderma viride]